MRKFTLYLTLFGLVLCLAHYLFHDYDSVYLLFYALSVPAWFATVFTNVYDISMTNLLVLYVLTIASWSLIGFIIDRFTYGYRRRSKS
ncbi:hypothetical protein [Paenibacillus eucommiae]|uniref:Lipid-A-disaccharide synthase-like uncharacterized protein n=1 Tax=Paenibacillus eucommiae TaxID=1355755 RepID=A0ABS4J763_9BACL|nr:hypothetical protein [Paenibacillus eucommiae]MBP1994619.1 lipid-A-disaccharide synthase-like uncharacterized protein [Paenibacillus eucommiae]